MLGSPALELPPLRAPTGTGTRFPPAGAARPRPATHAEAPESRSGGPVRSAATGPGSRFPPRWASALAERRSPPGHRPEDGPSLGATPALPVWSAGLRHTACSPLHTAPWLALGHFGEQSGGWVSARRTNRKRGSGRA